MAEKVAKLNIKREKDFMYYIKDGSVWKVARKQPGVPKGRPEKVADGGFSMDTAFIYFLDKDGDVSRAKRAIGGPKRKPKSAAHKSNPQASQAQTQPRKSPPHKNRGKVHNKKTTFPARRKQHAP